MAGEDEYLEHILFQGDGANVIDERPAHALAPMRFLDLDFVDEYGDGFSFDAVERVGGQKADNCTVIFSNQQKVGKVSQKPLDVSNRECEFMKLAYDRLSERRIGGMKLGSVYSS